MGRWLLNSPKVFKAARPRKKWKYRKKKEQQRSFANCLRWTAVKLGQTLPENAIYSEFSKCHVFDLRWPFTSLTGAEFKVDSLSGDMMLAGKWGNKLQVMMSLPSHWQRVVCDSRFSWNDLFCVFINDPSNWICRAFFPAQCSNQFERFWKFYLIFRHSRGHVQWTLSIWQD